MIIKKKNSFYIFLFVAISFLLPNITFASIGSLYGFDTSSPQGYINSIYRYGISLIVVLATAGVVYGGIRYMTSAGNEEAVTSGKGAVIAALSGLAIALLSHMILRTIDPRLVELRLSVPEIIQPDADCESDSECGEDQRCVRGECLNGCQNDSDCSSGQTCIVYTDGHGVCENPRSSSSCESDDDCSGSSVCLNPGEPDSMCQDPELGQNGHGCVDDTRCEEGLDCVEVSGHHWCTDGEVGSRCHDNNDCDSNTCNNNFCAETAGVGARDNGVECDTNGDCSSGVCATGRTPHICVAGDGRSSDGSCNDDEDCLESYYCNTEERIGTANRKCLPDLRNGSTCYDDTWCVSEYCSGINALGGTCADR